MRDDLTYSDNEAKSAGAKWYILVLRCCISLALLSAFFVPLCLHLMPYNPTQLYIYGDQANHYIQAQSIAFDRDLLYTRQDYVRFFEDWKRKPLGLFLKYDGTHFYYAKPFLYSLYLAPFIALAHGKGVVIANTVLAAIIALLVFRHFRKTNSYIESLLFLVPALVFTQIFFYLMVAHPDLFEATLLGIAVTLWLEVFRKLKAPQEGNSGTCVYISYLRSAALWASLVMGFSMYSKPPFFTFYIPFLILLFLRNKRWALFSLLTVLGIFILFTAVHFSHDGSLSPYSGNRMRCQSLCPYENSADETNLEKIVKVDHPSIDSLDGKPLTSIWVRIVILFGYLPRNSMYYFFGRQTGIFIYQVGCVIALILLGVYWRRRQPGQVALLAGLIFFILVNFWAMPQNYFGGTTSLGNRYALQILPVFFLLVPALPRKYGIIVPVVLCLTIGNFFMGRFFPMKNKTIISHLSLLQKYPLSSMPLEKTQLRTIGQPPLALNWEAVRFILLKEPPLQNRYWGFFLPPDSSYKTCLFFPEKHTRQTLYVLNGSQGDCKLHLKQNAEKYQVELKRGTVYEIEETIERAEIYRNLRDIRYLKEIVWKSSKCWNNDGLYKGSRELGLYVSQPVFLLKAHGDVTIYPQENNSRRHTMFGWSDQLDKEPYDKGRWAGQYTMSAVIFRPDTQSTCTLSLKARCPFPDQKVNVFWNGTQAGTFMPTPEGESFETLIEADMIQPGAINTLLLEHERFHIPSKYDKASRLNEGASVFYETISLERH